MNLILYCDESIKKGKFYSNFYGGALVDSKNFDEINGIIQSLKDELNLKGEVKWKKVTAQYLDKYIVLIEKFFDLIQGNKVKIRIMFTQNCNEPEDLTKEQMEAEFFLLYYQFIKHAFGLKYCNDRFSQEVGLRIYFDKLPDTKEKCENFKDYIHRLQDSTFHTVPIRFKKEDITEVDSHKHPILQCMDIILGSMSFRLNDGHLEKPPGSRFRGKKTVAKEKLYNVINRRIRQIYPNFNIGVSTGWQGNNESILWIHPYRHWLFRPTNHKVNLEKTKRHKK